MKAVKGVIEFVNFKYNKIEIIGAFCLMVLAVSLFVFGHVS